MFYVETLEQGKTNEDQISLYIDKSTKEKITKLFSFLSHTRQATESHC